MRRVEKTLVIATLALGALLLALQAAMAMGSAGAVAARARLREGRPLAALEQAERALAFDPWQTDASHARLIALQRLGRWEALAERGRAAVPWHAYSPAVLQLLGEAEARLGRPEPAAEALWAALGRAPRPRDNPAQIWRLTMLQSALAWGPDDARARAAARRTLALLDQDPHLSEEDRADARREAEAILNLGR